ncbi:MAG: restriction endonuclease [Nanoarchaeota archaeon]
MVERLLILDGLDGYQFEELIAKIMKRKGYDKIRVTSKSRDQGRDIIMEGTNGETILVECKHQQFVGRPIIQKLQGAINYEEENGKSKEVKGIIVTSGNFSKEAIEYNKAIGHDIELIDGKQLRALCKKLNIVILNGRIQIIHNKSFRNINEKEVKESFLLGYTKIYGHKKNKPSIKTEVEFRPACFIKYNVSFDTHTSVGCIDSYLNSDKIIIDGVTGKDLDEDLTDFFFSGKIETEDINDKNHGKKIYYEFTENDIEEHAINSIMEEHEHDVSYTGSNNVTYTKTCTPKRRDIDIKEFLSVYMPFWESKIKIQNITYKQEFYVKGNNKFYLVDDLKKCKICDREEEDYQDMNICPECGRIVCEKHIKIDYLDKETPICTIHAKPFKLYIQNKYFATKENKEKYAKWWKAQSFFKRFYEDKIAIGLSIAGICFIGFIIIGSLS